MWRQIKMGDRGNIVVDNKIWLYTHWGGSGLEETLRNALERGKDRWSDRPYLIRIIFSEMIQDEIFDTTGFGIDYVEGDGGTDIYIDSAEQIVSIDDKSWTFEEFVSGSKPKKVKKVIKNK
jgi:hypothetical protein